MSKKCPKCENKKIIIGTSEFAYCPACEYFGLVENCPEQTVFDRITQSEETLAETYMFNYDRKVFKSLLLPHMVFNSRKEAHAATVARLKEVAE